MAYVGVTKSAGWINGEIPQSDEITRLIKFFVLNSPVEELSARIISLSDYGWHEPWKKPFWLNKQLKASASNHDILYATDALGKMDEALNKADLLSFPPTDLQERICFYDCKKNQFMSVFYHIRNGFAHGRFNIVGGTIVMEDVSTHRKGMSSGTVPVSARIIIKTETLLSWIEVIENGEISKSIGEYIET